MTQHIFDYSAAAFFFLMSIYCILSPRYDDGIIGKLLFAILALSSYAIISSFPAGPHELAHSMMTWSLAAIAGREFFIHRIWPRWRHRG